MRTNKWWRPIGAAGCIALAAMAAAGADETAAERDARMEWWREAKFGMFIHWGVYAVPAGTYHGEQIPGIGEWIMHRARIPVAEYKAFARQFDPVDYDPEAWVALAKGAGMKYIVITSKHHDGFALFDSAVTDWDIVDATPYGRDLLRPLVQAAHRAGLKIGFYYSEAQDWNHPGGAKAGLKEGEGWDEAQKGSFDDYLRQIAIPQVREILSNYDIDVLWWDTPTWMTAERAAPLAKLLELRPGIITNNRLGGGFRGDTETPEQHIPAQGYRGRDWETCMTMNDTWGYKSYDHNWKSRSTLIRNLVDIVSKGGNYLLNVGPTARGVIPQPSQDLLHQVGDWMKVNGDAIYGTQSSPFASPSWGRCTVGTRDGKTVYYLHVFDWQDGESFTVPLSNRPLRATVLADPERAVACTGGGDAGISVQMAGAAPDASCSVIVLEIDGDPIVIRPRVAASADGSLDLTATAAELLGETIQVETKYGDPNIGFWTQASDAVRWPLRVTKAGRYNVSLDSSCPDGSAGAELLLQIGDAAVPVTVAATGGWDRFSSQDLGEVALAAGDCDANLTVSAMPHGAVMNLRRIILTPTE